MYKADINIMPHKELLDPQGKAVKSGLSNLKIVGVEDVRIGKRITLTIDANSEAEANERVEEACKKLLANAIMESYEYTIEKV